jgi:hypothetical protein
MRSGIIFCSIPAPDWSTYDLSQLRPLLQKYRARFDDGSGPKAETAIAKLCGLVCGNIHSHGEIISAAYALRCDTALPQGLIDKLGDTRQGERRSDPQP